ncbi:molybdenum cofactor biosynthesis protein B [Alcaligenaceae bacterium]|nr:molybdenum cofactor biosynthesis protein B [Alcaligenaceae bacterium]
MSKAAPNLPPVSLNCAVLTISDTRNSSNDTSGDYLVDSLLASGHRCDTRSLTSGNLYQLRKIISDWIANDDLQVIITNGGTGFTHGKSTVDAIAPLLDQVITGFGELFRHLSYQDIGSSTLQSDAFAGAANNKLVFCLPGSTGACRTGWEGIIKEQLDSTHAPCNFGSHYHA